MDRAVPTSSALNPVVKREISISSFNNRDEEDFSFLSEGGGEAFSLEANKFVAEQFVGRLHIEPRLRLFPVIATEKKYRV